MKKLVICFIMTVLSVSIITMPATAICPDPNKPVPWKDPGVKPNGDGDPWDVEKIQPPRIVVFSYRGIFFPMNWSVLLFNKLEVIGIPLDFNAKDNQPPNIGSEETSRSGQL